MFWCTIYFYDNLNMLILYLRVFIHIHILHKEELLLPRFTLRGWEGERKTCSGIFGHKIKQKTPDLYNNSEKYRFLFSNRCVKINPHKSMRMFDKRIEAARMPLDLWGTALCWMEMH